MLPQDEQKPGLEAKAKAITKFQKNTTFVYKTKPAICNFFIKVMNGRVVEVNNEWLFRLFHTKSSANNSNLKM